MSVNDMEPSDCRDPNALSTLTKAEAAILSQKVQHMQHFVDVQCKLLCKCFQQKDEDSPIDVDAVRQMALLVNKIKEVKLQRKLVEERSQAFNSNMEVQSQVFDQQNICETTEKAGPSNQKNHEETSNVQGVQRETENAEAALKVETENAEVSNAEGASPGSSEGDEASSVSPRAAPSTVEMFKLGPHGTEIPKVEYEKIKWSSASVATRKLLMLIFDRDTLATHSLSGRPSPAFKHLGKPLKGMLCPEAVKDIIFAVTEHCKVSEKEVRASITTKCADENKMMRMRKKRQDAAMERRPEANAIPNSDEI